MSVQSAETVFFVAMEKKNSMKSAVMQLLRIENWAEKAKGK